MTLAAGSRLGPYEIVAELGAGGMGEVYRARDTRLGRDVAVKVLPAHLSANADVIARFEREAKTISSLSHPGICTLFDVGREGDTDYLVMELLEGETLGARLAKGALPTADVLRIGAEIADALDRAHRAGGVGKRRRRDHRRADAGADRGPAADGGGDHRRHLPVHGSGAAGGPRGGRPRGSLGARLCPLRDGHRPARLRRGHAREPDQRDHARLSAAQGGARADEPAGARPARGRAAGEGSGRADPDRARRPTAAAVDGGRGLCHGGARRGRRGAAQARQPAAVDHRRREPDRGGRAGPAGDARRGGDSRGRRARGHPAAGRGGLLVQHRPAHAAGHLSRRPDDRLLRARADEAGRCRRRGGDHAGGPGRSARRLVEPGRRHRLRQHGVRSALEGEGGRRSRDRGDGDRFDTRGGHAPLSLVPARRQALPLPRAAQRFDPITFAVSGSAVPLIDDARMDERFSRGVFSVSTNGLLVCMTGKNQTRTQLQWLDRGGRRLVEIGEPADYTYGGTPELSPDGRQSVMPIANRERGTSDVWIIDLDSGRRRRLTVDQSDHPAAIWDPNGRRVVVSSGRAAEQSFLMEEVSTDGSALRSLPFRTNVYLWPRSISPDGRVLLFDAPEGTLRESADLWAMPLDGRGVPEMVAGGQWRYDVSPDGTRFLVTRALQEDLASPVTLITDWTRKAEGR